MKYTYFSKYNPFFRKNLLKHLIGLRLTDIKFNYLGTKSDDYINRIFNNSKGTLGILEFNKNLNIQFGTDYQSFRCCELRESPINNSKCSLIQDGVQKMRSVSIRKKESHFDVSVNEVDKHEMLKKLIGSEVKDVFLLKQTEQYELKYRTEFVNRFGVRGFGLKFENSELLVYFLPFKGMIYSTDSLIIEEGLLERTNDFAIEGETYEYLNENELDFQLPKVELPSSLLIDRKDILEQSLIDIASYQKIEADKVLVAKIIAKNREGFDVEAQINFLNELKKHLLEHNCGVADIKFGLDADRNLKLVRPIDIIGFVIENIYFIDSILDVLKDFPNMVADLESL